VTEHSIEPRNLVATALIQTKILDLAPIAFMAIETAYASQWVRYQGPIYSLTKAQKAPVACSSEIVSRED